MALCSCKPIHQLLTHGWYAGLAVTAGGMILLNQDYAPAIVLLVMLPIMFLCRGKTGVLLTALIAAILAGMGFMIGSHQELSPWLRSEALTIMLLAPVLALALVVPAITKLESKKMSEAVVNQSSMSSMSDSTSRETVGKVTPVANRSRAA